jgi:hypothetical protein
MLLPKVCQFAGPLQVVLYVWVQAINDKKKHLRFKLLLTDLQILGEVRSFFMVNYL